MLRHRLVRQSALNISANSETSSKMLSPQLTRRRPNSSESNLYKQLSSESLDDLIHGSGLNERPARNGRRHSVACGVLYVDVQKPKSLKAVFNSAVRRVSGACSLLSTAPSSTYNLSPQQISEPPIKKEEEVLLPHVLGTFHQKMLSQDTNKTTQARSDFQVNRRFSTDSPPPSYSEATGAWKQHVTKQKLASRTHEIVTPSGTLVTALEHDDALNLYQ